MGMWGVAQLLPFFWFFTDKLNFADYRMPSKSKSVLGLLGTAVAVTGWFAAERNQKLLEKLRVAGLQFTAEKPPMDDATPQPMTGFTFVIIGTLPSMSRGEAKALIESYGGKVTGSVSKKTSYLLAGEKAGNKLAKAEKLSVMVLDEEALKKMVNNQWSMVNCVTTH